MPLRQFDDAHGNHWTVWSTVPDRRSGVPDEWNSGWLTFESLGIRKRLPSIPSGWEEAPDERLRLYLGAAEKVTARKSGPHEAAPA